MHIMAALRMSSPKHETYVRERSSSLFRQQFSIAPFNLSFTSPTLKCQNTSRSLSQRTHTPARFLLCICFRKIHVFSVALSSASLIQNIFSKSIGKQSLLTRSALTFIIEWQTLIHIQFWFNLRTEQTSAAKRKILVNRSNLSCRFSV